jgi:hypothetical protein
MGIRDQLTEILAALRPIYYRKYLTFVRQENFNSDRYIDRTARLFQVLNDFRRRMLMADDIEIEQDLPEKCQLLIDDLETDDSQLYLANTAAVTEFLDNFLNRDDSSLVLARELDNPTPINRRVIDEQLRPQAGIVDRKKMEIVDGGGPFDETAFQDHNHQLIFSRKLYWEQLQTNIVQADLDDFFDCRDANDAIKNADAGNFLDQMDAVRTLFDTKIKPVFT